METRTSKTQDSQKRAPVEAGVTVRFGMDVHAGQITVSRQVDGQSPQPAQKLSWERTIEWIQQHQKAGAVVHSCYEAGPCGYGLHRTLEAMGVQNLVVAPQLWDRARRVKTDKRDARELCERLDRYLRGHTTAFSPVRVPTPEQERQRALGRQRATLVKERQRCDVRGHGLMLAQGHRAPCGWWRPAIWEQLRETLPPWLRGQTGWWQAQALRYQEEIERLTPLIEQYATANTPKGVGALTSALLGLEVIDWKRFKNRRQVGSYTGLCPGEHSSGSQQKQLSITKHGNPRLRHCLIEATWRLLEWQPDYPPIQKLRAASGARTRKRLAVAAARRLAVDLWRINTGQCTPEKLHLKIH